MFTGACTDLDQLQEVYRRSLASVIPGYAGLSNAVFSRIAYGTMFVARPAVMLVNHDLAYGGLDLRRTLPLVNVLALAGGVAFVAGYELRPGVALGRRLPEPQPIPTRAGVAWSVAFSVLAAVAFAALLVHAGGFSGLWAYARGRGPDTRELVGLGSYVWYASRLVVPAALCLFALALRERSRRIGVGALFAVAASLLVTVPMGSRIFLLPLFGGMLVFAYLHHHRRPSALVLLALIVVGVFASYAAVVVREPERRAHAGAQFALLVHRPGYMFHLILYRGDAEMAPALAGALTVVPSQLGHRYGGATIGELFVRPIPRQLWRGKPQPGNERVVAAAWPNLAGYYAPSFSPLLSFYWDFGIAGVVACMALFGICCRALCEWFCRCAHSFAAQLIYSAALWYVVAEACDDPVDTIVFASFVVLPLVVLERFSAVRRAARARRGGLESLARVR